MTLREMREAAGLTLEQAATRLRDAYPGAPRTRVGLWHIEQGGTDRLCLILAMAAVYNQPRAQVEIAALMAMEKGLRPSDMLLRIS